MNARAHVDAGVCGLRTTVWAASEDDQHVTFEVTSECEKVRAFAAQLRVRGEVDAFQEISPKGDSVVLSTAAAALKGCCRACAAPIAVFKAMQVAAGLALPKHVHIQIQKEP